MKYIVEHPDETFEMLVSNTNLSKNIIENGKLINLKCGDCHRHLEVSMFSTRVRNGKRSILTTSLLLQ